jgi:cobalt/nickel transport system permease protein
MHIPDGFIDGKTALASAAFSAAGLGLALRQVQRTLPRRKIPLLGLAAAFLFAAQMVNFPVAGGTSGHLIGSALVAALLGPGAAVVVVTTVLIVQCFLFADGGVTALGANVFNMALVGSLTGYAVFWAVSRCLPGARGRITAIAFAGWCSVVMASVACAGQLAWSGTVSWAVSFPAMTGVHMLIGIGEALISALVWLAIQSTRPEMVEATRAGLQRQRGPSVAYGLLLALGLAVFVTPFACPWPDGLERVATKLGFANKAMPALLPAPAPDYQVPGIHWAVGATAIGGAVGALVVFSLAFLLARLLVPGRGANSPETSRP